MALERDPKEAAQNDALVRDAGGGGPMLLSGECCMAKPKSPRAKRASFRTRDEAMELIREAIEMHIERLRENAEVVPFPGTRNCTPALE